MFFFLKHGVLLAISSLD